MIRARMRASIALLLAVMIVAAGPSASPAGEKPADGDAGKANRRVYLLIGGDNMAGRTQFVGDDAGVIPRCELLNDRDEWEPATLPLNRYSSVVTLLGMFGMNPGYTFAPMMAAAEPSVTIGLVVNAECTRRGSKIDNWVRGKPCYDDAVRRARAAGTTGTLEGILWHQGESDVKDVDAYAAKLQTLIAHLREDLANPELPFVAGEINPAYRGAEPFNAGLAALVGKVPAFGVASAEGFKTRGSVWFVEKSMKMLGRRYAEAMLKIRGKDVPDESKVAQGTEPLPKADGYEGPRENLHIYILIGQSNMSGRAEYTKDDAGVIERCWLLNAANEWEPARVPFNRYSSLITDKPLDSQRLNPGYGFVGEMLKHDPSINIGIISNARGSTFIRSWKGGYTKKVLERVKSAQKTGVVKGILWHQGESDFKNEAYLDGVKEMIEKYRTELGMSELPFVAGELLRYEKFKLVNDQLARLPAEVPHTGLASTEGLTGNKHELIRTDNVHFDMESMKTLGRRYAEAMLKLQNAAEE